MFRFSPFDATGGADERVPAAAELAPFSVVAPVPFAAERDAPFADADRGALVPPAELDAAPDGDRDGFEPDGFFLVVPALVADLVVLSDFSAITSPL